MFAPVICALLWIFPILQYSGICLGEVLMPYLTLYSPGDPDYTDVIIRRVGENLTLACELKGDALPRIFVWNYVPSDNLTDGDSPYKAEPRGAALGSRYSKPNLQVSDSGHYVCSAPEWRLSISKFMLVQNRSGECAKGALWCNSPNNPIGRCVLAPYVCDGYRDCVLGEDEAPTLCPTNVCSRPDKLNCSNSRCISEAACCRPGGSPALCKQPACCAEHPRYARLEGWGEPDYPALFEDRHAPDEYGFIQSTIYTVTACALIFMIAVVLLVSAICKMQMKRAALRSYTSRPMHAQLNTRQMPRFPPCYEASRLLEERGVPSPLHQSPLASPASHPPQLREEWVCNRSEPSEGEQPSRAGFGLASLSALFATRYRQVSTENPDVELRTVPPSSPRRRPPTTFLPYRSPTSCDLNTDLYFSPEVSDCGRDLNYMGTPLRVLRERPRPLTLQLGRFQLSIPRLTRRRSLDRRPDTPNVTELNIEDIDFVRLNSNETYTLNGRTIRLLGADFENYPSLNDNPVRPPPYTESMRYKVIGPPPEYLSRDGLNENGHREQQARSNIEMPPCYDELSVSNAGNNGIGNVAGHVGIGNAAGHIGIGNVSGHVGNAAENISVGNVSGHVGNAAENICVDNVSGQVGNAAENICIGNVSGHIGNAGENCGNTCEITGIENVAGNNTVIENTSANIGFGNEFEDTGNCNIAENTVIGNAGENNVRISHITGNINMSESGENICIITADETYSFGNTPESTGVGSTTENTSMRNTAENTGNTDVVTGNANENSNCYVTNGNKIGNKDLIISNVRENDVNSENNGNSVTTGNEKNNNENDGCIERIGTNGNAVKNDFNSVINDLPAIDSDFNANGTETCSVDNENNEIRVNNDNIEC